MIAVLAASSLHFSNFSTSDQDLCEKIRAAAFSAFNAARRLAIVKPAAENTLSDGADVAGTHNTLRASFDMIGSLGLLFFHHSRGLRYTVQTHEVFFLSRSGTGSGTSDKSTVFDSVEAAIAAIGSWVEAVAAELLEAVAEELLEAVAEELPEAELPIEDIKLLILNSCAIHAI